MAHDTKQTPAQVAAAFAALKPGRVATYIGGGRIRVGNKLNAASLCTYTVTTTQAIAAIAKATGGAS